MKEADRILMRFCSGECPPELSKYEDAVRDVVYIFLSFQFDRWVKGQSIYAPDQMGRFFAAIQGMATAGDDNAAAGDTEGNHAV